MRMNEEMEKLGKEIIGSYDVRVESIKQLKKETEETLKGFRLSLEKMGSDLRNDLAEGVERRKAEVSQTLDELTNSRMQMSKELKEDLAAGVEKRKEEVSKTLDDFKVSHLQMSKELKENLSKFNQEIKKVRAELEKASLSWQQTASILQEKRSGVKPIPKVLEKKTIKEALPKKAKISEELSDKKQLIKLINGHPEGIKLTEIGAQLEKDWRWYIPIVKELMEEGKIRKEENLYYPAI